jgi:hypothetical protein
MEGTMEVLIQVAAGILLILGSTLVLRTVALADGVIHPARSLRLVRRPRARRATASRLRKAA